MIRTRLAAERGHANHGWLDARHSFSFADYHDRAWMGYSNLRVINEDRVAPGTGFGTHGHSDMEIITYPLAGAVRHRDSTGGEGTIRHGEIQVMHAGRGIRHSEVNASPHETLHLLQIWIAPHSAGVAPGYEQAALAAEPLRAGFVRTVAPVGAPETAPFRIHADASLFVAWPAAGSTIATDLLPGRKYYLHLARGAVRHGAQLLQAGDALLLEGENRLALTATTDAELLLFDLP